MNTIRALPHWAISAGALLISALFFRFAMRGYAYIAYTLIFAAALIVVHRFAPASLWRACVILVSLGLMYLCLVEIPIVKNCRTDAEPERKYLIVLGAEVRGTVPSLSLERRLDAALEYLSAYPDSTAIVTGGQGNGEAITEARCMYDWLTNRGVASERVLMEDKATSTMENLRFSFDLIRRRGDEPDGNIAIVSSSYHLYRAKCMAEMQGAEAAGVACKMGYPLLMLNFYIREAFGVTHLWVFGN